MSPVCGIFIYYMKEWPLTGNNVSLDSKAQRSSEQTNTLSFCPRSSSETAIGCRPVLLLLVRGMMEVLELVVFVGGISDKVKPQNFF